MRRPSRIAAAAAALALSGGGLLAAAELELGDPVARGGGEDVAVNSGAGDLADIRAQNSPTLVRHPRDGDLLAVSSRIDTPAFSCALHVSRDRGRSWRPVRVPRPPGEEFKCYAPDVAFGPDGRLHLAFVTLRGVGNVPNAVWIASSTDGGRTLGAPRRVAGPRAFGVRLATDPRDARRLHLTWLQAREVGPLRFTRPGSPIVAVRSADGGRTWSRPTRVSSPRRLRVLAPTPAVGPGGELHVLFVDVGEDRLDYHGAHDGFGGPPYAGRFSLVLARARDGGRRWQESVVDDRVVPIERFVAFLPSFPALAVDRRSGRIFAAYHDGRHGDADVLVWALDPGAAGWRGPVRTDASPSAGGTTQRLPQLALAPGGRLDVAYLDRRGDPRDVRTRAVLQSSHDGGRTFGPPVGLSSRSFDPRIGFGSERGMADLGSRLGLVAHDRGALAVWPDTRSGTDASGKQDLRLAAVRLVRPAWEGSARRAGIALLAGALAAGLLLVAGRRLRR